MTRTVWKFPLEIELEQEVTLPKGAKILSAHAQNDIPCLWAECSGDAELGRPRTIRLIPTGHRDDAAIAKFLGTILLHGGLYVLHAYEVTSA